MKNNYKKGVVIIAFAIFIFLVCGAITSHRQKTSEMKELNAKVQGFSATTRSRISNAVVTLPDGNIIVGLRDGKNTYTSTSGEQGLVTLIFSKLVTHYTPGVVDKNYPRLEVFVPMQVTNDPMDGSTYVVLFRDRGSDAVEKSHIRLGGLNVEVTSIAPQLVDSGTSYTISIDYISNQESKQASVKVIDGRFVPESLIVQ